MTNLFNKDKRIAFTSTKKGRVTYVSLMIAALTCFVIGSFGFFAFLYYVCNMIGSIVCACPKQALDELVTIFPNLVALPTLLYIAGTINRYLRAPSKEYRLRLSKKAGIALIIIGGLVSVYVIIGWISGLYSHIGVNPTYLYPLDTFLLSLVYVAVGVLSIIKRNQLADREINYIEEGASKRSMAFRIIFYLAASWAFAGFIHSFYVIDFMHGHLFYSITLMLMMLLPVLMLVCYEVFYVPLKKEYKREFLLVVANITLAISLFIVILYMIALSLDPNAPNDVAYGVLPVEFTASVNAFTYIFGIVNLAAPLAMAVKAIFGKQNK